MAGTSIIRTPAGRRAAVVSAQSRISCLLAIRTDGPVQRQIGWVSKYLEILEAGISAAWQPGHGNPDIPGGIGEIIVLYLGSVGIAGLVNF